MKNLTQVVNEHSSRISVSVYCRMNGKDIEYRDDNGYKYNQLSGNSMDIEKAEILCNELHDLVLSNKVWLSKHRGVVLHTKFEQNGKVLKEFDYQPTIPEKYDYEYAIYTDFVLVNDKGDVKEYFGSKEEAKWFLKNEASFDIKDEYHIEYECVAYEIHDDGTIEENVISETTHNVRRSVALAEIKKALNTNKIYDVESEEY